MDVYSDYPSCREDMADPPENLGNMINIAERLADGFPFVLVDLYNIRGEIMFGEMTFYPWGGGRSGLRLTALILKWAKNSFCPMIKNR